MGGDRAEQLHSVIRPANSNSLFIELPKVAQPVFGGVLLQLLHPVIGASLGLSRALDPLYHSSDDCCNNGNDLGHLGRFPLKNSNALLVIVDAHD